MPVRKNKRRRDRVRLQEGSRIREPGSGEPETVPFTNVAPSSGTAGNKPTPTMLGISSALNLVTKISDKMSNKKQGK